jgi:hypothetical protein
MGRSRILAAIIPLLFAGLWNAALGQTTAFTYQGRLLDTNLPATGSYDFEFGLFATESGGTAIGTLTRTGVAVDKGVFSVTLDYNDQFPGDDRWLEISVKPAGNPNPFVVLVGRQRITSTPYATRSGQATNADFAENAGTAETMDASRLTGTIETDRLPNQIEIGGSPDTGTAIIHAIYAGGRTGINGIEGITQSEGGKGVYGLSSSVSGNGAGGWFESNSISGRGVVGIATDPTSSTYGGYFEAGSGFGVYGVAGPGTVQSIGGRFRSLSDDGIGVIGQASLTGGHFLQSGEEGAAVFGHAQNPAGISVGGRFLADGASGLGLVAVANGPNSDGVWGQGSGFGVWAQGRLGASGVKSFRIDHPQDPENKYLYHYSMESPEVLNVYSGTVMLDANGQASVTLPGYFGSINRDPRYTLTAVGRPMPMLHIAEEIGEMEMKAAGSAGPGTSVKAISFRIGGGAPNTKVSWRVEAVRNDLWTRNNETSVEKMKVGREKGTYQHPEFYGQPKERGMGYQLGREPTKDLPSETSKPKPE